MVLTLDSNSEIGAYVRNNLRYMIYLRDLIRSREVLKRIFILRKDLFSFIRAQHVFSYDLI